MQYKYKREGRVIFSPNVTQGRELKRRRLQERADETKKNGESELREKKERGILLIKAETDMAKAAGGMFLALLLLLSISVPCSSVYNSGECFFNTKGSCEHMGKVYDIGESWITSDCYQCVCMEPFGVGCCDYESKPVDYPDWCEIIRKPESCTSVAVMRANRKLPCLWGRGRLIPASGQPWMSENDPLF